MNDFFSANLSLSRSGMWRGEDLWRLTNDLASLSFLVELPISTAQLRDSTAARNSRTRLALPAILPPQDLNRHVKSAVESRSQSRTDPARLIDHMQFSHAHCKDDICSAR